MFLEISDIHIHVYFSLYYSGSILYHKCVALLIMYLTVSIFSFLQVENKPNDETFKCVFILELGWPRTRSVRVHNLFNLLEMERFEMLEVLEL
jgi:hypothetical protein